MIHRVRKTKDNNIECFLGTIKDNETSIKRHYNIEELKAYYKNMQENLVKNGVITIEGKIQKQNTSNEFDLYDMLQIYNKQEQLNKNVNCFLPLFIEMIKQKGHTYAIIDDKKIKIKRVENVVKNAIVNAQLITKDEFEIYKTRQAKQDLTETEKYQIQKYLYFNTFGLEMKTVEELNPFYNKLQMIQNAKMLINNTVDEKYLNNSNLFNKEKIIKIQTIYKVLNIMNINVSTLMNEDITFDCENMKTKIKPISDLLKENKIVFDSKKTEDFKTTNALIGSLRNMLINFGIDIECTQKTKRDKTTKKVINDAKYKFNYFPEVKEKLKLPSLFKIYENVRWEDYCDIDELIN